MCLIMCQHRHSLTRVFYCRNQLPLEVVKEYLKQEPDDYEVQLAKGICHLELDQFGEALAIFKQYASSKASDKIKGEWYQAMTYLKQDDKGKCKTILQRLQGQGFMENKIAALLAEL